MEKSRLKQAGLFCFTDEKNIDFITDYAILIKLSSLGDNKVRE